MAGASLLVLFLLVGATPTQVAAGTPCDASGSSSASCSFVCGAGEVFTVTVHANDSDADVDGEADCGNGHAECSGSQDCNGSALAVSDDTGSCEGEAHEFWPSGMSVSCTSADGAAAAFILLQQAVSTTAAPAQIAVPQSAGTSAHLLEMAGTIVGYVCGAGLCKLVAPVVEIDPETGHVRASIG